MMKTAVQCALQVCSEYNLFRAVILWAQHRASLGTNAQQALSQLLPLVRFPLMSPEELQVKLWVDLASMGRLFQ
jgi:hypothetical protein